MSGSIALHRGHQRVATFLQFVSTLLRFDQRLLSAQNDQGANFKGEKGVSIHVDHAPQNWLQCQSGRQNSHFAACQG